MRTVRIERELAASPAALWHALTDPAALTAWFWPPRSNPRSTPTPGSAGRCGCRRPAWARPPCTPPSTRRAGSCCAGGGTATMRTPMTSQRSRSSCPPMDPTGVRLTLTHRRPTRPSTATWPAGRPVWTDCRATSTTPTGSPGPRREVGHNRSHRCNSPKWSDPSPDVRPGSATDNLAEWRAGPERADGGLSADAARPAGRSPVGLGTARGRRRADRDRSGRRRRVLPGRIARPASIALVRDALDGDDVSAGHRRALHRRVRPRPAPRRPAARPARAAPTRCGSSAGDCAGRAASARSGPARHDTLALHEMHTLGPDGLPAEHQTIQVIKSTVDVLGHLPVPVRHRRAGRRGGPGRARRRHVPADREPLRRGHRARPRRWPGARPR